MWAMEPPRHAHSSPRTARHRHACWQQAACNTPKTTCEERMTKEFFQRFKSRATNSAILEIFTTDSWDAPGDTI
eukprot:scaffold262370_cov33-Tisochrysis_lutea.AAC.3